MKHTSRRSFSLAVFSVALLLVVITLLRVIMTSPQHPALVAISLVALGGVCWLIAGLSFKV